MLFFMLACSRNDYFSNNEGVQFSLSDSEVVELETLIEKSLSYRHRPSCDLALSLSTLNFGDSEATLTFQSDVYEVAQVITISPSQDGDGRNYFSEWHSIACRDKSYFTTITASSNSDLLIEFHSSIRATMVEPGDLGAMDLSIPRVELSAESLILSHSGEE